MFAVLRLEICRSQAARCSRVRGLLTVKYEWPPTIPINHCLRSRNRQNRSEVLSYDSMRMCSRPLLAAMLGVRVLHGGVGDVRKDVLL